jgi:hypothetical protein
MMNWYGYTFLVADRLESVEHSARRHHPHRGWFRRSVLGRRDPVAVAEAPQAARPALRLVAHDSRGSHVDRDGSRAA